MHEGQHVPRHTPPPDGCGWEDSAGEPVVIRVVLPCSDLGDRCPHCGRAYDEPDQAAAPPSIEHLQRAFEAGKAEGRTQGQREILQRLFENVSTPQELTERAAALAFASVWPEGEPCPLTVADLAALVGVSPRTAARRKADAQNGR